MGVPGSYGACAEARVAGTSWVDSSTPPLAGGVFYHVTGVNRLREEGTMGFASNGVERISSLPCP
jgi:hypothetical protein